MNADEQAKWDAWCDGRIETRVGMTREAIADVFETRKQHADDVAALRREISELRNSPPLFSAPDKKLASAMVRVGEELHAIREGIEAARGAVGECAKRSDLGGVRQRLESRIAELEECSERTEKNSRAAISMVFNVSNALERVHALLARLAVATDNEHVLTAVDKLHLPDEEKPFATVLSLADLRRSA
jgi:chromosome segregation ATPase